MDFDLGEIPNKKYFSIQEVSEILDIEAHTIRYWEKEFAKSFSIKRIGNRRMFQQKDIINLVKIKNLLKQEKMTIKGAKEKFKNDKKIDLVDFKIIKELKEILKIL